MEDNYVEKLKVADPETVLMKLKLLSEEHFDDFVILVRRKNSPDMKLAWSMSDTTWARGAMQRVLQDLEVTDTCRIERDNPPPDR